LGGATSGSEAGGGRAARWGAGGEKNLYWYTTYGEVSVVEHLFWQEGPVFRPFGRAAGISCCGYSQPLQRRMTDFGADLAFGQVPAKLKEHYGIEVPVSAVRTITEAHASHIHAQDQLPTTVPAQEVPWVIAETDGSMIPLVDTAPAQPGGAGGDRRKTRQVRWQEARLS
jgi:hypothetical protein